jgi:3-oxoacyl-[acyl-carrier protein] reductase
MKKIEFLSNDIELNENTKTGASKTVLITGASGGIGNSLIDAFLKNNFKVIAHSRIRYEDFESKYLQYGDQIVFIYSDLSNRDSLNQCFNSLSKEIDQLDVIIHNAAKEHGGLLMMTKLEDIQSIFEINFFSTIRINQILLKLLRKSDNPSIINISSISGLDLDSGNIAYGLSKASLNALTSVLSKDFANFKIRVNSIAPGLVDTKMSKKMQDSSFKEMKSRSIRGVLDPLEIANIALFLSSEASSAINGQVIRADGGSK